MTQELKTSSGVDIGYTAGKIVMEQKMLARDGALICLKNALNESLFS
jgi:hypothetical protein